MEKRRQVKPRVILEAVLQSKLLIRSMAKSMRQRTRRTVSTRNLIARLGVAVEHVRHKASTHHILLTNVVRISPAQDVSMPQVIELGQQTQNPKTLGNE
jgi:ribosomal protein L20A (L18A)